MTLRNNMNSNHASILYNVQLYLQIMWVEWQGGAWWHSPKVSGSLLITGYCLRRVCACSSCACVGFLWVLQVPPTYTKMPVGELSKYCKLPLHVNKHAHGTTWRSDIPVWVCLCFRIQRFRLEVFVTHQFANEYNSDEWLFTLCQNGSLLHLMMWNILVTN